MSAFSRSLAAIQVLATYRWGPRAVLRFDCSLDVAHDIDRGTPLQDSGAWRVYLVLRGDHGGEERLPFEGVGNSGASAQDDLLAKLRKEMDVADNVFVTAEMLKFAVHAVSCAGCGVFQSRVDTPDYCKCGAKRAG